MKSIVEQLAKVGVDKSWSTDVEKQLNSRKTVSENTLRYCPHYGMESPRDEVGEPGTCKAKCPSKFRRVFGFAGNGSP